MGNSDAKMEVAGRFVGWNKTLGWKQRRGKGGWTVIINNLKFGPAPVRQRGGFTTSPGGDNDSLGN